MNTSKQIGNVRFAAFKVVYGVFYRSASLDAEIEKISKDFNISGKDYSLLHKITYGTVQNCILLDYYIKQFSNVPFNKLNKNVICILRIAFYQFIFLNKIPAFSIINEAVETGKKLKLGKLCGFINAVLRKAFSSEINTSFNFSQNVSEELSIRYSHPLEQVNKFIDEFGADFTEELLKANNDVPDLTLQINSLLISDDEFMSLLDKAGIEYTVPDDCKHCLIFKDGMNIKSIPGYSEGYFYVQDLAAKLSSDALDYCKDVDILDTCSSPGGKTVSAYMKLNGSCRIISCDINERKIEKINENLKRLRIKDVQTIVCDAEKTEDSFIERFNVVIADVPCSGTGVIRKIPEIRFKTPESISELNKIQLSIISNVSKYVKAGGELLYSTCSVLKEENEGIIDKFLSLNLDFIREDFRIGGYNSENGCFTFYPNVHGTDGFFVCKLRKKND